MQQTLTGVDEAGRAVSLWRNEPRPSVLSQSTSSKQTRLGRRIIGVDEAGRGALAGPIIAAALMISDRVFFPFDQVKDSKRLSDSQRRVLFPLIRRSCIVHFGVVSNRLIDRFGIQQANVLAIELALAPFTDEANMHSDYVGAFDRYACFTKNIVFHVRGESIFPEIAAASIVAKVFRDDILIHVHDRYPVYGFNMHKGYGTKIHKDALNRFGLSSVHRSSFLSTY